MRDTFNLNFLKIMLISIAKEMRNLFSGAYFTGNLYFNAT